MEPVTNATNYIIEIAEDGAMTKLLYTKPVEATSVSTSEFFKMPIEKTLYWRVRACGNSYNDGVSDAQAFTALNLEITSPADSENGVPVCPTFTWTFPDRDVTLEISTSEDFEEKTIIYTAEGKAGKHTVAPYNLAYCTQYFARMHYVRNGEDCTTPTVGFTTEAKVPAVPTIAYPVNGGVLHANEHIAVSPVEGAKTIRIELSASSTFPSRSSYIQAATDTHTFTDPKAASEIRISGKGLVDGTTYYLRVRTQYMTEDGQVNGEFSPVVSCVYSTENGAVDDIIVDAADAPVEYYDIRGIRIENLTPGTIYIERRAYKAEKTVK